MKITLYSRGKSEPVTLLSFNKILEPKGLYLIEETLILEENDEETKAINIHKILNLLSCKIKEIDHEKILGSYLSSEGYIEYIPVDDDQPNGFNLVDYHSYLEICDLTGDKKKSFKEFIKSFLDCESLNVMELNQ